MANVGGVFAVLISGAAVGIVVAIFEMLLDVRNRAMELEVPLPLNFRMQIEKNSFPQVPFLQELVSELRFISKCSGNTKIVNHKKSSRDASLEHESRSLSRSTASIIREQTAIGDYGFRPSLKNLDKLDLMPENEVIDKV